MTNISSLMIAVNLISIHTVADAAFTYCNCITDPIMKLPPASLHTAGIA